jgi:hypothetical protein
MNEAPANPALELAEPPRDDRGWSGRRMILFIVILFGAHLAAIYFLGSKKQNIPRTTTNVPQWQIALTGDELIALDDPTLFALPHANDFATRLWNTTPIITPPDFRWTESPRWLPVQQQLLGEAFREFIKTNLFAETRLNFKPTPILDVPPMAKENVLPKFSALQSVGKLQGRQMLHPITVPTLFYSDLIAPSRIQAVVEPEGNISSVILLESSGYPEADQEALRLARAVRFIPVDGLMIGELIFQWHTVATNR